MQLLAAVGDVREVVRQWRSLGEDIAFVPTMGNLHAGHIALIEAARAQCRRVVASVFVNPAQFGPNEDFARYPRTPDEDAAQLAAAGCDALFLPEVEEVYPFGLSASVRVELPALSDMLCGHVRPGHFAGVASVVLRLFHIVEPDFAWFGEKDYQQLLVIRRLALDLSMRVRVVGLPTVRGVDGLALSSRNQYLDAAQRKVAPVIWQTLQRMREARREGEAVDSIELEALAALVEAGFVPDYAVLRGADDLSPAQDPSTGSEIALIAARLGSTRLIDNLRI